jgi:2,4-dienoyl-CoA reductase-like NADH-dependent reductase (Old Yellow Enzyme family)
LFRPLRLADAILRNRIAMAPMTREMAPNGIPTAAMAAYYSRRAAGGVGLIITEGSPPNSDGSFGADVPRFYGDDVLEGWRAVVESVHANGAAIFAQLWHVGAFSPSLIGMADSLPPNQSRLSPSGLAAPGRTHGDAMTAADIDRTISDFAVAAARARSLGFDGVELHAAHGYLPDQFLWAGTNERSDHYGGAVAGRLRFAVELVKAIKQATSAGFPVSLRMSQWKQLDYQARIAHSPDELAEIVQPLAEAGVDLFHCSTRRFWEPEFPDDPRNLAAWVKALAGKPVMTVGSVTLDTDFKAREGKIHAEAVVRHVEILEQGIADGLFDLVAIGRALIANPDWVDLVRSGRAASLRAFDKAMLEHLE